jgi:hypothetical protein
LQLQLIVAMQTPILDLMTVAVERRSTCPMPSMAGRHNVSSQMKCLDLFSTGAMKVLELSSHRFFRVR